MAYSLSKLTTAADCDVLTELAQKEKDDLQYRKTTVIHQSASYLETATETEDELLTVQSELSALNTVIASLPDGAVKDSNVTKQKKLELKAYLLTEKKENYGSVALLAKEFEIARLDVEIAEADVFIAAIAVRKAEL